ncbi:hypothetical protein ACFLSQ_02140 [Bacteroidota bacterium]
MSYSKLIHEYLDGQLNMVREDVLFAELAQNSELRVDFNQQVQLQNVALSDMRTISPPADSTNVIFSSLGFAIPSNDYFKRIQANPENGIPVKPSIGKSIGGFMKKHTATIAAIFITASLTTAVFMLTDNRFAPVEKVDYAQIDENIPVMSSQENSEMSDRNTDNTSKASIFDDAGSSRRSNQHTRNIASEREEANTDDKSSNIANSLKNALPVNLDSSPSDIDLASAYTNDLSRHVNSPAYEPIFSALNLEPAMNFIDGDVAFLITFPTSSTSNVDLDNYNVLKDGGVESNFNVTALYKFDDKVYFGPIFGRENFAQKWLFNSDELAQRNKALLYYGLAIRGVLPLEDLFEYANISNIGNLGNMISLYGQLAGGMVGSNDGGLIDFQGGINLAGFYNIALTFGYEYKVFYYNTGSKLSNTNKHGLVLGAGISF